MCKNKHLSLDDRLIIERELSLGKFFKYIGNLINKDCTTISKEVRNHYKIKNYGGYGRVFNNCIYRNVCCESLINSYPHRKDTIEYKMTYILNNWFNINCLYKDNLSCPMESQISHNITDLFTARPKACSIKTIKQFLEQAIYHLAILMHYTLA